MNDSDFYVFQSDSMGELVKERQKNKALQNLLHINDAHTKYYYIENEPNGNHAKHCDNIVDKHPNQRVFIQGWFNRINDIGRKCGCDTIYNSRHLK